MTAIAELQNKLSDNEKRLKNLLGGHPGSNLSDENQQIFRQLNQEAGQTAFEAFELLKDEQPEKAAFYFYQAQKAFHPKVSAILNEALNLLRLKKEPECVDALEVDLDKSPDELYAMAVCAILGNGKIHSLKLAHKYLNETIKHNHVETQNLMGYLHLHGFSVTRDFGIARQYFEAAAVEGHAEARNNLGWLYQTGLGVPKDYEKSWQCFEMAAAQGSATALNNLGWLYQNGLGAPQDYEKARQYFEEAAAKGCTDGLFNLGSLYYSGLGVPQNYGKARQYFEAAAAKGCAAAQNILGSIYYHGRGVPQDYEKARQYSEAAAAKDHTGALNNLGFLYQHAIGVDKNYSIAAKWYWFAATQNCQPARVNLKSDSNDYFTFVLELLNHDYKACAKALSEKEELRSFFLEHILEKLTEIETNTTRLEFLFDWAYKKAKTSTNANDFLVNAALKLEKIRAKTLNAQGEKTVVKLLSGLLNNIFYPDTHKENISDMISLLSNLYFEQQINEVLNSIKVLWHKAQSYACQGEPIHNLPLKPMAIVLVKGCFPGYTLKMTSTVNIDDIDMLLSCIHHEKLKINRFEMFLGKETIVKHGKQQLITDFFKTCSTPQNKEKNESCQQVQGLSS
ncbi:SEL1-like repeat protein [Legionella spiritensis]|uniref:SEL1-like repeat protein n=1 Tax=Legionella spiritensis TaxID=452 RepID=UPI00155885B8|nr:tetratricopeptide repeat protein [Legionella spiritensis]